VQRIAKKLKIQGYVENLKPYDVLIVAEGDEENLREFIKLIRIRKYPISVEELKAEWGDATGEFEYFEIKRGEWQEELFERLDMAGRLLYRSVELGEKNLKLTERSVELGEKSLYVGEQLVKKVDEGFDKLNRNLDGLRLDLREYMDTRFKEIYSKISEIEKALKKAEIM